MTEKREESAVEIVLGLILLFGVGVPLGGYIFQCGWSWFVVSAFGVAPLTFWQALGLSAFISFVKTKIDETGITPLKGAIQMIATFLVSWGFMYVVYLLGR